MYRDREEVDETKEISLEDTQEYGVANVDGDAETEIVEGPEGDFEDDPVDEADYEDEPELEDDEYVEGGYFEDEDDTEPEFEVEDGPSARDRGSEESVTGHLKAAGAAAIAHVKSIEVPKPRLPNRPQRRQRPDRPDRPEKEKVEFEFGLIPGIVAIVVASLVVGIGVYFLAKGSGDDVDTARLEGTAAGKQAGAIEGAAEGFSTGFQKGRDAGFDKAYIPAYKLNYKRAFEQAGLDVPSDGDIDVPEP